jgi:hypothetical protein
MYNRIRYISMRLFDAFISMLICLFLTTPHTWPQVAAPVNVPHSWRRRVFYAEAVSFLLSGLCGTCCVWLLFKHSPGEVPEGQTLAVMVLRMWVSSFIQIAVAALLGPAHTSSSFTPAGRGEDCTLTLGKAASYMPGTAEGSGVRAHGSSQQVMAPVIVYGGVTAASRLSVPNLVGSADFPLPATNAKPCQPLACLGRNYQPSPAAKSTSNASLPIHEDSLLNADRKVK